MKKIIYLSSIATLLLPAVALANTQSTLSTLINTIIGYLNQGLILLMGVAVVVFVWNVIKYFVLTTEEHTAAAPYVLWSVVGFFIILSFWGLVNILQNTFNLQNGTNTPSSWASFSSLFPGSSGTSGTTNNTNTFNNSGTPQTSSSNSSVGTFNNSGTPQTSSSNSSSGTMNNSGTPQNSSSNSSSGSGNNMGTPSFNPNSV